MKRTFTYRGFTLIELLVVVAIIGILATVVLVSLNGAREKTRNAAKVQAARQIQTAMTLYYDDNNNYPVSPTNTAICLGDYSPTDTCSLNLTTTATNTTGDVDVQVMVQEYLGGNPEHYRVVGTNGEVQDAFYYACRNAACTKYAITYILEGIDNNCGNPRGLNRNGVLTSQINSGNTSNHTYCIAVLDREVPADLN